MTDSATHINTLHVEAPAKVGAQVQLRLSTQLSGADLHPPGLAPSQVLLVKNLPDPNPGGLRVDGTRPILDRSWERATREALADCLHRAVRPRNGRVPPGAEAVLFQDEAEAWACWGREQVVRQLSIAAPWWTHSLEVSSGAPAPRGGGSPSVAAVWRARPRLVPAMAAHLASWDIAMDILRQMSESEAGDVLRAVCTAFGAPTPSTLQAPTEQSSEETAHLSVSSGQSEQSESAHVPPEDTASGPGPGATPLRRDAPPWRPPWRQFVEKSASSRLADGLAEQPPAHRQLLGVALALRDSPLTVRAPAFQRAWRMWRRAVERPVSEKGSGDREAGARSAVGSPAPSGGERDGDAASDRSVRNPEVDDNFDAANSSSRREASPIGRDSSTKDDLTPDGNRRSEERGTDRPSRTKGTLRSGAYAATEIGGVLYLVNVLSALDLPAAAETPPIGEYVGAWAVLEALARALLGPDDDVLHSNDPLWRVLADLDGRRPNAPAGRALEEALADAEDSREAFRMPAAWLEAPHVEAPIEARWAVSDGRLRLWSAFGCMVDLGAKDDPKTQVEAEWERLACTGHLERAETLDAMPLVPEPAACTAALAWWVARATPYLRGRLAVALGVEDQEDGWLVDAFSLPGKLYVTGTHVDLVLPLEAARIDARIAGLDRSPGWWSAGGRVVRFHFRENP